MRTEELNEYIFATLVDERAFRLWQKDCSDLIDNEKISAAEAMSQVPPKENYIPSSLEYLVVLRRKVFAEIQEER